MTLPDDTAPHWPKVDEDNLDDLRRERARLINCLAAVEEAMRDNHSVNVCTV